MAKAAGIIFSNLHDSSLPELTSKRTMASVPFGCRYRLIDFALSNMVNSGITKIGVVVHDNYRSLMDHIGTGKDWDLARRSGGIKILPPFITAFGNVGAKKLYSTRLEAMIGVSEFISRCNEEYIVLSDCDLVLNADISQILKAHIENEADLTLLTAPQSFIGGISPYNTHTVKCDENGRITDISIYNARKTQNEISTNLKIINRVYLLSIIDEALSRGYTDLYSEILARALKKKRLFAYSCNCSILSISSLKGYYDASMSLLSDSIRNELITRENRPIFTKVRNSAPTLYKKDAQIRNSYIADGCEIEGYVENSIIFRGVKISKGACVKNSILLQNTFVGEKTELDCVITDKDVTLKNSRKLSGHRNMPFFIPKNSTV